MARLVACGNEQVFGIDFNLTFAAVMELSTVKVILVFARRWGVPARHGDIPNAYVKADKEQHFEIYLEIPQGVAIGEDVLRTLGVDSKGRLALRLRKSLYGLRQAGRLWSKLLHAKLEEAGFTRCVTDMCLYYKRKGEDITLVGAVLSVKDLGMVNKFLGMRVDLDNDEGY
ncbi:hypothetical protein PC117_g20846 [Phytophthora cactorum]|uniref:Reverse transcriptase Ty1/copia-type domain-containing protein n=1 Tax=Phytophthora cactorum TaxID=29920 RepID=A0A8T1BML6_9STRA|nr:hypothetical protein PC117_g20846 [Phytophthora cactorum]